jgi:tetratricopeptide (TPR) repeat protein
MRFTSVTVSFLVLLLAAGCASTPTHRIPMTGDILVDGPRMIAEGPQRDRVLWQYRTAAAAMRRGQFDVAKPLLDDALLTLAGVYGKDAEARKARGLFNKEARKTFIGEPYERSMAYFYRGVIYWRDGELDNARACFRSAEFEDSDAENAEYKGDWVLPDYLDGLATTKLAGDGSDAFKRAKANAKNINLPDHQPQANVLFILEYGPGPEKYRSGEFGQQLRFRARGSPVSSAQIKTGEINLPVAPCDDLNFQATTRGGRVMDHVLANKAVFKGATDSIGTAAIISGAILADGPGRRRNSSADEIGAGLMIAGFASKLISAATTPEADIRAWDNLPRYISFAALKMSPGEHVVTVEFNDANGASNPQLTKTITVNVPADRDKVVFVSDTSTTPQSQ